jgi:hypothetical protein
MSASNHWVILPKLPGTKTAATVVEIKEGERQEIGRAELYLPDKRISRKMFVLECAKSEQEDEVKLKISVLGMNTSYVQVDRDSPKVSMRKGETFELSNGSQIYLLPGGLYVVDVYHYELWQQRHPELTVAQVRQHGQRQAAIRAQQLRQQKKQRENEEKEKEEKEKEKEKEPPQDEEEVVQPNSEVQSSSSSSKTSAKTKTQSTAASSSLRVTSPSALASAVRNRSQTVSVDKKDKDKDKDKDHRGRARSRSPDKKGRRGLSPTRLFLSKDKKSKSTPRLRSASPLRRRGGGGNEGAESSGALDQVDDDWVQLAGVQASDDPNYKVRAYLGDNVIFRQLGIHNTFKTLVLTVDTSVVEMRDDMLKKTCKGMTATQRQLIQEECSDYTLYNLLENGALAKLADAETPFRSVQRLAFRSTSQPLGMRLTEADVAQRSIPNLLNEPVVQQAQPPPLPDGSRMIRAYVDDNAAFRSLGIHNTFKTLIVNDELTVDALEQAMLGKLCKAMTYDQKRTIREQCEGYRLHVPSAIGADRLLEPDELIFPYPEEIFLFRRPDDDEQADQDGNVKREVSSGAAAAAAAVAASSSDAGGPQTSSSDAGGPRTSSSIGAMQRDGSAAALAIVSDDEEGDVDGAGYIVRAHVKDSMVFRQLGLNNTFKTLLVRPGTTVAMMEEALIKKMCKAMTPIQTQVVQKECRQYRICELMPDGGARLMEPFEKPHRFGLKEFLFKPAAASIASLARSQSPPPAGRSSASATPSIRSTIASSADIRRISLERGRQPVSSAAIMQHQPKRAPPQQQQQVDADDAAATDQVDRLDTEALDAKRRMLADKQAELEAREQSLNRKSAELLPAGRMPVGRRPQHEQDDEEQQDSDAAHQHVDAEAEKHVILFGPQVDDDDDDKDASKEEEAQDNDNDDDNDNEGESRRLCVIVQVCDGWKVKLPLPGTATVATLVSLIIQRLAAKPQRLSAAKLPFERLSDIVLVDSDDCDLYEDDLLQDAWETGEIIYIRWQ